MSVRLFDLAEQLALLAERDALRTELDRATDVVKRLHGEEAERDLELAALEVSRDHYRTALAAQTDRVKEFEDLVRRAVAASGWLRTRAPRWIHVMNAFGLGATRARALCDSVGVDPEEMAGR